MKSTVAKPGWWAALILAVLPASPVAAEMMVRLEDRDVDVYEAPDRLSPVVMTLAAGEWVNATRLPGWYALAQGKGFIALGSVQAFVAPDGRTVQVRLPRAGAEPALGSMSAYRTLPPVVYGPGYGPDHRPGTGSGTGPAHGIATQPWGAMLPIGRGGPAVGPASPGATSPGAVATARPVEEKSITEPSVSGAVISSGAYQPSDEEAACHEHAHRAHPWRAQQIRRDGLALRLATTWRAAEGSMSPADVRRATAQENRARQRFLDTCADPERTDVAGTGSIEP